MNNTILFESVNNNGYLYDSQKSTIVYSHPILIRIYELYEKGFCKEQVVGELASEEYSDSEINYYVAKYDFLLENGFGGKVNWEEKLSGVISARVVESQLSNLDNLVFQVINDCNLQCKYCCYGELYENPPVSKKKPMTFDLAQTVIDYMSDYWNSKLNYSQENIIGIGFYGGEPLLNFELIKKVVSYISNLRLKTTPKFVYNMTTNGMLLDRHMDFMADHNFSLLISLDGNKLHDYLRVDKNNRSSFDRVFANIKSLQHEYPDYFDKKVRFNSLLNSKSSVMGIYDFIFNEFGKVPMIGPLSVSGLKADKIDEFKSIYKSYQEDVEMAKVFKSTSVKYKNIGFFFYYHLKNSYKQYCDLLLNDGKKDMKIPTGTCIPFFKKMFVTVDGDILACERIGLNHVLGKVTDCVSLDFEKIANIYNDYYSFIKKQCSNCFRADDCPECFFQFPFDKEGPVCSSSFDEDAQKKYLGDMISVLENDPSCFDFVNNFVFA